VKTIPGPKILNENFRTNKNFCESANIRENFCESENFCDAKFHSAEVDMKFHKILAKGGEILLNIHAAKFVVTGKKDCSRDNP
jgi:hypothetical protein